MDAVAAIKLLLSASILLLVFALGLQASFADATSLLRNFLRSPHWLLRAMISMYVIVPAAAVALALAFDLPPALRGGLLAVASPRFRRSYPASSSSSAAIGPTCSVCWWPCRCRRSWSSR